MTDPVFESLAEADICWDENGTPYSSLFDDLYFSKQGGLAETQYVFIEKNFLPARWQSAIPPANFTLAETGFGTGLNFLTAAELWLRTTSTGVLHYLATEKHPVGKDALSRLYALWPHFSHLTRELLPQLPPPVSGIHRLLLAQGRIRLSLLWGDSQEQLAALRGSDHPDFRREQNPWVDAWFLDGFSPAKNPQMWTHELFQSIADLSRQGTTFSTFTAAGQVRRGLQEVGFNVSKTKGFGAKREMLIGTMICPRVPVQRHRATPSRQPPWYLARRSATNENTARPSTAAVIGAGIAGCSTAHALAQRNIQVTLFERHSTVAAEASGNLQGIIYPKLSLKKSPLARFSLAALLHACRFYLPFWQEALFGSQSGVLTLPEQPEDTAVFQSIARQFPETLVQLLDNTQLQHISGIALQSNLGLWFPNAGWVKPPLICDALSRHRNIAMVRNTRIAEIRRANGKWHTLGDFGQILSTTDLLIIACGASANHFEATRHLPLKAIRGQLTYLPATSASAQLKTVVCGAGYLAPALAGWHTLGATYAIGATTESLQTIDHQKNLAQLEQTDSALPAVLAATIDENTEGRVAFRCTTPDYLPIAGPAPIWQDFMRDYAPLRHNARSDIPIPGNVWPNLYLNCGHGSRGLSYAPLCAELLASQICGEAPPLELALRRAIHPGRFIIRELKRS